MASFDPYESNESPDIMGIIKYPMKRLELSVRNFIKALDVALDRLHRHSENIKKLTNAEDWPGLHKEQVNASRTVQQINANIREIERARTQVVEKDLRLFDVKVQDVKMKALSAVDDFMMLVGPEVSSAVNSDSSKQRPAVETGHGCDSLQSTPLHSQPASAAHEGNETHRPTQMSNLLHEEDSVEGPITSSPYGNTSVSMTTCAPAPITANLHVAPQHSDVSNSWEQLQENIVELNDLVHHFADQVEQQGEVINSIEENIDTAHANVKEGTTSLAQASKYKSALLPVVGAVVGGMVGGPIGFVAGMKLGGLAGVVGGAAGFAGGRMLKKHQSKIDQTEMENLSDKSSISLSEINDVALSETQQNADRGTEKQLSSNHGEITQDGKAGQTQQGYGGFTDIYGGVTSSFRSLFSQTTASSEKS